MSKSKLTHKSAKPAAPRHSAPPHGEFEQVSPLWLLRAFALIIFTIAACFYLTYASLFYFGQWQLVLHPSRQIVETPANRGLAFESIRFGIDASGQPQLTGWWIPAATGSRYENFTLLYLHGADGSLSDTATDIANLHALGVNLFTIDYRGYGESAAIHPNELRMTEDTESAYAYLTNTRHLQPAQIIPFGDGVGATLAAKLAASHQAVPAVILRNPPVNILVDAEHDSRSRLLPVRLIFHERFEITSILADLKIPKLLIATDGSIPSNNLFHSAADPKISVTLASGASQSSDTRDALTRFLDEYLPKP
jgi:pimeloyl-ACP methyl ester carboxylesterase